MIFVLLPLFHLLRSWVPTVGRTTVQQGCAAVLCLVPSHFQVPHQRPPSIAGASDCAFECTPYWAHRLDLAVTYYTRVINIYEIRQNDGASGEPCGSGMVDDRYVDRASEALKTQIDSAYACRLNVSSTR
jgi:hypothetical protein